MAELSPAAQAVRNAAASVARDHGRSPIAAALRAVALYCPHDRRILMTIADELENP